MTVTTGLIKIQEVCIMKLYIADAFTKEIFGGNPAGVVILGEGKDFPEDEVMRKTAAELRYSETAFIKFLSEAGADGTHDKFNVRYFTPAAEVDLCGHATIASFSCLREARLVRAGTTVFNRTLAGDLDIVVCEDSVMMDMAAPEYLGTIDDEAALRELYEVLGITYEDNSPVLEEQCLANGGDGSGTQILRDSLHKVPVGSRRGRNIRQVQRALLHAGG